MRILVFGLVLAIVGAGAVGYADETARQAAGAALLEELRVKAEQPLAAQTTASCTLMPVKTRPRQAHGTRPLDYEQDLILRNARIAYSLHYWVTARTEDGNDPEAVEGSTGLGMPQPTTANWYDNNFFEFAYGEKPILKTVRAQVDVETAAGPAARGRVRWCTPQADVVLLISLAATAGAVDLECTVTAKGPPQPIRLGFRAYPGHYAVPRARRAATALREYVAPAQIVLGETEPGLVLFDQQDRDTGCGLRIPEPRPAEVKLDLGEYGVTVTLLYPATPVRETGPIRLWEFARTSLNAAMSAVFATPASGPPWQRK